MDLQKIAVMLLVLLFLSLIALFTSIMVLIYSSRPSNAYTQCGMISHYGYEAGRTTASGQPLNVNGMTAAHRTLPFGTKVRVFGIVVTINDRGPFTKGRILDLTTGAARVAGMTGTKHGCIEVLGYR